MKEKKLRIEDALNATKAAIEEGIVPGGGCALMYAICKLEDYMKKNPSKNREFEVGMEIVKEAMEEPLKQIAINAGKSGDVIVERIIEAWLNGDDFDGYNAYTDEYVCMVEEGIIDPVKVTRTALQNAVSVSSTFLTTEAAVVSIDKEVIPGL